MKKSDNVGALSDHAKINLQINLISKLNSLQKYERNY
jgi:hypothetical protein